MPTLDTKTPTWIPSAPINYLVERRVKASPDQVWALLTDYETWTTWFPGAKVCRPLEPTIDGVGSKRFVHMDAFKVTEEITAWEPSRRWAMSVVEINLPILSAMAEEVTITPTDDGGSHIAWVTGVTMKGWAAPLKSVLVGKTKKAVDQGLAAIDSHVVTS